MKTYTATYSSPLGPIVIESDGQAITSLRFSNKQASAVPKEAPKEAVPTPPIIAETIQWLDDYFIPCHRVIAAKGQLGGYAYGTEIKKRLLELEQHNNDSIPRDPKRWHLGDRDE